ncbi:DNA-binding protein [Plesiocystis pacifica SIR-1]|uniref:DNA-binding protein n=1 Tax=Plesiocystis pacifica SIR-1 TaxID=391625 RepID=A6G3H4_9BACT|nr:helix-turn-helix transcriptional regulator [Plesiocystis pacifica]EDM79581.1 DNA-binding protein [Plesiocystis pacifica SIR-1]
MSHKQRSDPEARRFGRHIRALRSERGLTQELLAERSGLSADSVRSLENGKFSPSRGTLRKLCTGLDLQMSTFFLLYETGGRRGEHELLDLLRTRSPAELRALTAIVRELIAQLDQLSPPEVEGQL